VIGNGGRKEWKDGKMEECRMERWRIKGWKNGGMENYFFNVSMFPYFNVSMFPCSEVDILHIFIKKTVVNLDMSIKYQVSRL